MNVQEYVARISYKGHEEPWDLKTLTVFMQHHIRSVPFENPNIHCGEAIEFGLGPAYKKIVKDHRSGWCLDSNLLFSWVLQTMGCDVTLLGGHAYIPQENRFDDAIDYLLLKVVIDGKPYLVDVGFGIAFQMWQPVELVSGKDQPQMPGIFRLTEDNSAWCFEKIKCKLCYSNPDNRSLYFDGPEDLTRQKIYSFTLQPRTLEEFWEQHTFFQTSPGSFFLKKSICGLQTTQGFWVLVGKTLTEVTYDYKDNMDLLVRTTLADEEVKKTLQEPFNIRLKKTFVPIHISLVPKRRSEASARL